MQPEKGNFIFKIVNGGNTYPVHLPPVPMSISALIFQQY